MSFVSFNQKDLAKVLSNANLISPKKSEIDLFTFTKIEIGKEFATFTAINSIIYFNLNLAFGKSEIKEGLVFMVKTDLIAAAVSLVADEMVGFEIDLEKKSLLVQGSTSKHTLRIETNGVDDFNVPENKKEDIIGKIKVSTDELLEANKVAFTAVGNPKVVYQPEFLSVCYTLNKSKSQLIVVSTDRYRLAQTNLKATFVDFVGDEETPINFLLNPRNLQLVANCVVAEKELEFSFGKDYLTAKVGDANLTMRYGDGKFPDYQKIIPNTFACTFVVDTKETLLALRQVYFSARTNAINKNVNFTVIPKDKIISLISKTEDGNSSESTIKMENYEGVAEDWVQSFNADYLIDYISTVTTDKIYWEANPGKPSVLSPEGMREDKQCLISGLR
jgi:DNA polymerase III sliding clamp (beta) subunit (PCNA family)